MMEFLSAEMTKDVIDTLYGLDTDVVKKPSDAPDVLFDQRTEMTLGFLNEAETDGMYLITLNIPLGRVKATPEEFDALRSRLAAMVSESEKKTFRPATTAELYDFYEKCAKEAEAAAMQAYLKKTPADRMYSA